MGGDVVNLVRKKLGLVFVNDEQWIGGTYYTANLVHAMNYLSDELKPEIIVFSNSKDYNKLKVETKYPHLIFEDFSKGEYSKFLRIFIRLSSKLFGHKSIHKTFRKDIDALFIMQRSQYLEGIPAEKRFYWIPDFQDKHYPEFFTKEGLSKKHRRSQWIADNARNIILSSESVKKDWEEFYPMYKGKTTVVNFAVNHPEYNSIDFHGLRKKYHLPSEYFFSPNQFWAHKNHMVVIKAVEKLKTEGNPIVVAFSGKENDNRNMGYTESLKDYVKKNQLQDVVKFLGFIDRREQLKIMKHAKAVIQPSLFEGWSTVIEDALAMNQVVIASNIEVNKEQLLDSGLFFVSNSPDDLSIQISKVNKINCKTPLQINYNKRKLDFAENFYQLLL